LNFDRDVGDIYYNITMNLLYIRRVAIGLIVVLIAVVIYLFEKWLFSQDFETRGRLMRVQIVIIIQTVLSLLSLFVWKNIANVFGRHRQPNEVTKENYSYKLSSRIWKLVVFMYMVLAHSSYLCNVYLVRTDPHIYAMMSYFTLGFHIQLATGIVLVKLFNFLFEKLTRHSIRHKTLIFFALFYAISVSIYGFYNAVLRPPTIKHVTIPVKDLPPSLDGMTITHIGPIK